MPRIFIGGFLCVLVMVLFLAAFYRQGTNMTEGSVKKNIEASFRLNGSDIDQYFVVMNKQYIENKNIVISTANSLCKSDICMVGFFFDRNDFPDEAFARDFYDHGGWGGAKKEVVHYHRNLNTHFENVMYNCNVIPREYLNDCIAYTENPLDIDTNNKISARHQLTDFDGLRFGSPQENIISHLKSQGEVYIIPNDGEESLVIARSDKIIFGRRFSIYYNFRNGVFTNLLLMWKGAKNPGECLSEAKEISKKIDDVLGPNDNFSYYDESKLTFSFKWRFSDRAFVDLSNIQSTETDCKITSSWDQKRPD